MRTLQGPSSPSLSPPSVLEAHPHFLSPSIHQHELCQPLSSLKAKPRTFFLVCISFWTAFILCFAREAAYFATLPLSIIPKIKGNRKRTCSGFFIELNDFVYRLFWGVTAPLALLHFLGISAFVDDEIEHVEHGGYRILFLRGVTVHHIR